MLQTLRVTRRVKMNPDFLLPKINSFAEVLPNPVGLVTKVLKGTLISAKDFLFRRCQMNYQTAKTALEQMKSDNKNWARLPDGKIATRRDCLTIIRQNNKKSPESKIEMLRRQVG